MSIPVALTITLVTALVVVVRDRAGVDHPPVVYGPLHLYGAIETGDDR